MNMHNVVGLDFETYGAVDLFKHGLYRYVIDPTFRPLIAVVVSRDGHKNLMVDLFDFTQDYNRERERLMRLLNGKRIAAHNAGFEAAVLENMGISVKAGDFIDSAAIARAAGAAGRLESAGPQLLDRQKMEAGKNLIQVFSVPSKQQREDNELFFDSSLPLNKAQDWEKFFDYCELDAQLSYDLVEQVGFASDFYSPTEQANAAVTLEMNDEGWNVDVPLVAAMQARYLENKSWAEMEFRRTCSADDLNLNSLPQLKKWCADRGIRASSFDEKNVAKLLTRLKKRLAADDDGIQPLGNDKRDDYWDVLQLLQTKQVLGGSSLKKLQVIRDTVGPDSRLRDQYIHIGAGQSWRTTGRSVQMQNLKRLAEPRDMATVYDSTVVWTNDDLAENLRQVFTATEAKGRLIVGDFASVESRGLAWLANETWKLDAYRNGKDMYKVLAGQIYAVNYDDVTKTQRTTGKVGELSCGYGAGGGAVESFATGMGVQMSEIEAAQLVSNWRAVNPAIVDLWGKLDQALDEVMSGQEVSSFPVGQGWTLRLEVANTPATLKRQHPKAQSISMTLFDAQYQRVVERLFHGCYRRGRNICYYKPSQLKGGAMWADTFVDQKTKQRKHHSIYGGKMSGILTQSFCRELFFDSLRATSAWVKATPNVRLVGQFHDEIVLDWSPNTQSSHAPLESARAALNVAMTKCRAPGFPLEADIKDDYRYTK